MRARASILSGLALLAACGQKLDTTLDPGAPDASTDASTEAGAPSDASAEAGTIDAGLDDAGADADAHTTDPSCPSFNEIFDEGWNDNGRGWEVTGDVDPREGLATFKSTGGTPAFIKRDLGNCPGAHLTLKLRTSAATTEVTMVRLATSAMTHIDLIRLSSNVLTVDHDSSSAIQFNPETDYTVELIWPDKEGMMTLRVEPGTTKTFMPMIAGTPHFAELQIGVLGTVTVTADPITVEVDDIHFNAP